MATPNKTYYPSPLPRQDKPELKNAVERELRKISDAVVILNEDTSNIADVFYKTTNGDQTITNETNFTNEMNVSSIVINSGATAEPSSIIDFEGATNVFVPIPAQAESAARKDYVDSHDASTLAAAKAYVNESERWHAVGTTVFNDWIDVAGNVPTAGDVLAIRVTENCLYLRGVMRHPIAVTGTRLLYRIKKVPTGYTRVSKPFSTCTTSAVLGLVGTQTFTTQIASTVFTTPIDVLLSGALATNYQILDECIMFSV